VRLSVLVVVVGLSVSGCCDCQKDNCAVGTTDDSGRLPPDGTEARADVKVAEVGRSEIEVADLPGADSPVSEASNPELPPPDLAAEIDDAKTTPDGEATADAELPGPQLMVATAPDWLNLRDGPGSDHDVIRAIPCGGEVVLEGPPEGNWYPLMYDGVSGWANGSFLVALAAFDPSTCPGPPAWEGEVPGTLVTALDVPPYVEQDCTPTTFDGWPFAALKCTYNGGLKVTVADPSPELVAQWIVDAAQLIPALWSQRTKDPPQWKKGLKVFATQVLYQSSRIFPLAGQVDEGTIYVFDKGVTTGCSTGCYCRINSLMRQQWCPYADKVLGLQKGSDCLALYGTTQWTDEWAEHCLDNHRAAWTMPLNHHFRAMAYWANQEISQTFADPQTADGAAVVAMLTGLLLPE